MDCKTKKSLFDNVLVFGVLPPPVSGMPIVTQMVLDSLKERIKPRVIRLSPKKGMTRYFAFYKAFKVVVGALEIFKARKKSRMTLYMPADACLGMYYTLFLVILAKVFEYKIFLHHHSWKYLSRKDWRMQLITKIMGKSGVHIVLCIAMKQKFSLFYPEASSFIKVSNAVFFKEMNTVPKRSHEEMTIGHLSNLSVKKGLLYVFETFRELHRNKVPTKLILAGPPVSKRERDLIEKAQQEFDKSIEYGGAVYHDKKKRFFNEIDVFLFPTMYKNEAQPLVLFESLLNGVPFIAYARGCIPSELGEDGGVCIPLEQNFVQSALPILTKWAKDRQQLKAASIKATLQGNKLRISAKSELDVLIENLLQQIIL